MKKAFRPRGFAAKKITAVSPHAKPQNPRSSGGPRASAFDSKPAPRVDKTKLAFPKTWRHVAGTHAIKELLATRPKSVQIVLVLNTWKTSADLREMVEVLETKKIKCEEKTEAQ